jgi:hypothetical protein
MTYLGEFTEFTRLPAIGGLSPCELRTSQAAGEMLIMGNYPIIGLLFNISVPVCIVRVLACQYV